MSPPAAAVVPSAPAPARRAGTRAATRAAPSRPRRISGPARPPARRSGAAPARAVPSAQAGLAVGVLSAAESLSRRRAVDRLIRGRLWIALIAFALIGIVTLQLLVLQLNANIGRALERQSLLQRENAALSIEGSELASGERVEAQASHLGMTLVPIGALRFLTADPRADVKRAAAGLNAPAHSVSPGPPSAQPSSTSPAGETPPEQPASASAGAPAAESNSGATTSEGATAPSAEAGTPAAGSAQAQTPASTPAAPSAPTSTPTASAAGGETAPTSSAGGVGTAGGMGADQSLAPG